MNLVGGLLKLFADFVVLSRDLADKQSAFYERHLVGGDSKDSNDSQARGGAKATRTNIQHTVRYRELSPTRFKARLTLGLIDERTIQRQRMREKFT
jgi:hypothetical protein